MPLSRYSVGTYPETSSHATCQGTLEIDISCRDETWMYTQAAYGAGVLTTEVIVEPDGTIKQDTLNILATDYSG